MEAVGGIAIVGTRIPFVIAERVGEGRHLAIPARLAALMPSFSVESATAAYVESRAFRARDVVSAVHTNGGVVQVARREREQNRVHLTFTAQVHFHSSQVHSSNPLL